MKFIITHIKTSQKVDEDFCKYSLEEYSALRNEIVSITEQSRSIWIAMITLYITLFVFALEANSMNLLLITYIILIPFQCIINSHKWSVQKISTYIRCFFEMENTGIHWESLHVFSPYLQYRKKHGDDRFSNTILPVLLGALSSLYFIGNKIYDCSQNKIFVIDIRDALFMILSVILFMVLLIINLKFNTRYDYELMEVIMEYKNSLENKEKGI